MLDCQGIPKLELGDRGSQRRGRGTLGREKLRSRPSLLWRAALRAGAAVREDVGEWAEQAEIKAGPSWEPRPMGLSTDHLHLWGGVQNIANWTEVLPVIL